MSVAASLTVRSLCVLLPVCFYALMKILAALCFAGTCRDEFGGVVILVWALLLAGHMCFNWRVPLAKPYKAAFKSAAIQQTIILPLAALVLDGGFILFACLIAACAFWMSAGMIIARRPSLPSSLDADVVSSGFFVLSFVVISVASLLQFICPELLI